MKQILFFQIKQKLLSFSIIALITFFSTTLSAQVSGTVFRDLPVTGAVANVYGVKEANEQGVEGVTVTVYPGPVTTTTAADGTWGPIGPAGAVRVEYSDWPSYLQESTDAGGANTSIQFVTAPIVNLNFGLHNPADFSELDPPFAVIHHQNGLANSPGVNNTLISFPYNDIGAAPALTTEAERGQIGCVWGLAYNKTDEKIYTSAFLKRYVGLGPGGLGAIYSTDVAGAANAVVLVTIPNVGTINAAMRGLGGLASQSTDIEAFAKIGNTGLGDIDISDDDKTLYVVNLNDKQLYVVDIATGTITTNVAIPDPGCTNGNFQPFAVTYKDGAVYVGGTCNAETGTRANLQAYIYKFDPVLLTFAAGNILNFPLDYAHDPVNMNNAVGLAGETRTVHTSKWHVWSSGVYVPLEYNAEIDGVTMKHKANHPQLMFTDIEFLADGTMVIGFADRTGHQIGVDNLLPDASGNIMTTIAGGDILRATYNNVTDIWTIEPHTGGVGSEFFDDGFNNFHAETSNGGLAHIPGSNHVALTVMDPVAITTGGVKRMSTSTGMGVGSTQIYSGKRTEDGNFGKSHGMGDIELLTAPAPIEIGNLVWNDTNSNGIQDPSESGIPGIIVKLFKSDGVTLIGTATTDANGNYIFSNAPIGPVAGSHIYQIAMLMAGQDYIVRIENASGGSPQAAIGAGNELIPASAGEGANGGINNTDGVANTTNADAAVTAITIPITGANNHSFDFAFGPPPPACPPVRCGTVSTSKN